MYSSLQLLLKNVTVFQLEVPRTLPGCNYKLQKKKLLVTGNALIVIIYFPKLVLPKGEKRSSWKIEDSDKTQIREVLQPQAARYAAVGANKKN